MAWLGNPGCPAMCCADEDEDEETVFSICCNGNIPTTLYFSDGSGTEPLIYGAVPPFSPSFAAGSAWWGCINRGVTGGRPVGCGEGETSFSANLYVAMYCFGGGQFRLHIYGMHCSSADERYMTPTPPCGDAGWSTFTATALYQNVYTSCAPFAIDFDEALHAVSINPEFAQVYPAGLVATVSA